MQELVALALPPVPIKEDADPGYHALKEEDGQRPDERQGDSLEVGQAAAALALLSAASHTHWQVSQPILLMVPNDPRSVFVQVQRTCEVQSKIADLDDLSNLK